jgi:hypothetical protein
MCWVPLPFCFRARGIIYLFKAVNIDVEGDKVSCDFFVAGEQPHKQHQFVVLNEGVDGVIPFFTADLMLN